jgi:hypothetical protein
MLTARETVGNVLGIRVQFLDIRISPPALPEEGMRQVVPQGIRSVVTCSDTLVRSIPVQPSWVKILLHLW